MKRKRRIRMNRKSRSRRSRKKRIGEAIGGRARGVELEEERD